MKNVINYWRFLKNHGLYVEKIGLGIERIIDNRRLLYYEIYKSGLTDYLLFKIRLFNMNYYEFLQKLRFTHNWALVAHFTLLLVFLITFVIAMYLTAENSTVKKFFLLLIFGLYVKDLKSFLDLFFGFSSELTLSDLLTDFLIPVSISLVLMLIIKGLNKQYSLRELARVVLRYIEYTAAKKSLRTMLVLVSLIVILTSMFTLMGFKIILTPVKVLYAKKTNNNVKAIIIPGTFYSCLCVCEE